MTRSPDDPILLTFDLYRLHHYVFVGTVLAVASDFRDCFYDIVAFDYLAEDCILAGEPVSVADGDEKLRSVGVGAGVGHRQLSSLVEAVWRTFGFVFELVAGAAETGAQRVAALNHEVGDYAMENGAMVKGIG